MTDRSSARLVPAFAILFFTILLPAAASAQIEGLPIGWGWAMDAGEYELQIEAFDDMEDLEVTLDPSHGSTETFDRGSIDNGDVWSMGFEAPTRTTTYSIRVEATHADERAYIEDEFTIEVFSEFDFTIDSSVYDDDATSQYLVVEMTQPAGNVTVTVRSDEGTVMAERTVEFDGEDPGTPLEVRWTRAAGDVLTIDVRAESTNGSWASTRLIPWNVEAIFDNVNFESGSAEIADADVAALTQYTTDFVETAERVSEWVQVELYVGGYTDTVGSAGDNESLSEARARSIAEFMRDQGFRWPIFYQGFGESALAVETDDNVDEPQNRRAIFVLGTDAPGSSPTFPSSSWSEL